MCTPDTSAAPPVTCEFDWAELAGAVISGALVGALANYIGGSVCSYLQSKIPVAEVVKTIPQEMRTKVVQCIQGGGAQVIRRTYTSTYLPSPPPTHTQHQTSTPPRRYVFGSVL